MEILFNVVSRFNRSKYYDNTNSVLSDEKTFKIKFLKSVNSAKIDSVMYKQLSLDISFENINFSVSLGFREGMKKVLHNINGKFRAGHFIAIVGPSGAGKTTFLDILSGYQISGVNGTIYHNDNVRNVQEFRKYSSYITHDNHFQPLLTVWENMGVVADLKLGLHTSQLDKDIMIKSILATLVLDTSANVQARYLSGGQKKRLAIAIELIANPSVMFFDEPTTGLDSSASGQCLRLLQKLSKEGKTIICTIHQASAHTLQLFDEIYVLGDGRCLYQGAAENVLEFLNSINIPCPMYNNPIEYVIELASSENRNEIISLMTNKIENGKCNKWIQPTKPSVSIQEEENTGSVNETYKTAALTHQLKILAARSYLICKRDKKMLYMRILTNMIISFLFSILYWQIGYNGAKVRNNYNLLLCVLLHHLITTMILGILSISSEISILKNEYFNKRYSLKMYFAARAICEVPILIFCCLLFTTIVYPITGQPMELHRVAMFTVMSIQLVLVSHSLGVMLGAIFDVTNATFVGFALSATLVLLSGIGQDMKKVPTIIYWISRACFTKYSLEGTLNSIYGYDREILPCPSDELYCHYKYPQKFLKDIMAPVDTFWLDVIVLCFNLFIFKVIAFYSLKWKISKQKHS